MGFKTYTREKQGAVITREIRDYVLGEDLSKVFVDSLKEPEKDMGVIVRNVNDASDIWYCNRQYFEDTYTEA